ncbi:Crp/Fnr family transcriptional regulator [Piscirickettsia salmonis]|uniref:Anaerobic regulatory protein n=1 Tax=Piscirickettsia salmonis TaxID=1238 RepID=A0A9Q5VCW4_PISSA|nr:helix-turn-helix domain-containing protein [Piscirickettsia salmonis]ALA25511.1 bacterial regulatory s, crp family protein [Piscirickettsia salmonis]APS43025.1 Crp/Fnr family transcriptional regulator [Piscirickettsia salmonis]APS46374.1 Crp/Fnr family transcriptional regulator [Piscirickettsia salmonis]APS50342.1 Crp/Fnr family transcriptional regulator [Piscirickettsia salmonis]APS53541.1 Crp/Fnr family transcriptional regulator [Piscirickettsia salmonis]
MQFSCDNCASSSLCLPAGLSQEEMSELESAVTRQKVIEKGDILFRQGQPFKHLIALRSGSCKAYSTGGAGHDQVLGFFFPGDLLGLEAIHSNQYQYTVTALDTCSLCMLDYSRLLQLSSRLPELNKQLLMTMSREMIPQTSIHLSSHADERLASFLMSLSYRMRLRGFSSRTLHLNMTRQDIANHLGLTLETVSRTFKKLEVAGLIEATRRQVIILDLRQLQVKACTAKKTMA